MQTETTETPTVTAPLEKTFRIIRLQVANFKCLKAVDITPNREIIKLKGKNGAGKSTVLDSILAIFRGKRGMPDIPIRFGASKADVELDLGDIVATLKISASGGAKLYLKAKATGMDMSSPATLLASYSNDILLAPVEFVRLGETIEGRRKQAQKLAQLLGLDFGALDAKKKALYDDRTLVNRDLDTANGKLANYPEDSSVPDVEVSVTKLMSDLSAVQDHNQQNATVKRNWEQIGENFNLRQQAVADITTEIADLERMLANKKTELAVQTVTLTALGAQRDAAEKEVAALVYKEEKPIKDAIAAADGVNTKVRIKKRRGEILAEVAKHKDRSSELSAEIDAIDKDKQEQLESAKFPLKGLSFDDTGISLNGLPLSQASTAFQLKTSLAMGFAMKPRIPVVLFREWNALDENSQREVMEMTVAADGQIWAESWDSTDPTALEIVDGELSE